MTLLKFKNKFPNLAHDVFIASGAQIIGDVVIGSGSSVWFNSVVRGDVDIIRIGSRTNIQDNSVCHVSGGKYALHIGNDVTIGHGCIVHGCTIKDFALIGMGSILLDGCEIGESSLIAAGALVTEKMIIPPGVLAVGSPCKVKRDLTQQELNGLKLSALHYQDLAAIYLQQN